MVAPTIDTRSLNPDSALPREQCLAIGLGKAAAAQCGDLIVLHSLPAIRSMNVNRVPTLIYNSAQAQPAPSVAIKITIPSGSTLPDTIEATIMAGTQVKGRQRWPASQWGSAGVTRIVRVRDTVSPAPTTGIIAYTVQVKSIQGGVQPMSTDSVNLIVVNRQTSPFGVGWWLSGIEQLSTPGASQMLWVGGDGSARIYRLRSGSTTVWGAKSISFPDTIRKVGTEYIRFLPDSVRVTFDALGRHVRTANRQGHTTRFFYATSGKLDSLRLPVATSSFSRGHRFYWGSNYYIVIDDLRPQTTIWQTNGLVDSIIEVDTSKVRFSYQAGGGLLTQRTDRRGALQRFTFDALSHVTKAELGPLGGSTASADSIISQIGPVESRGIVATGSVDSTQFHTSLDGPRKPSGVSPAVDTAAFWLNRYGAPYRIITALGGVSTAQRNTSFPGLVTRLATPSGQILGSTYDSRGRVLTVTDTTWTNATTRFEWHSGWDQITKIVHPAGDSLMFGVDATTGDRTYQQDGRGAISQVNFAYYIPERQLWTISGPGSTTRAFRYDVQGNLDLELTSLGFRVDYIQDANGRTVQVSSQIDSAATLFQTDSIRYDLKDRDTLRIRRAPATAFDSALALTVRQTFDREGGLLSVARKSGPDFGNVKTVTNTYRYDLAGRQVADIPPGGTKDSIVFDPAGNPIQVLSRRGHTLPSTFDALNRLTQRVVPPVAFAEETIGGESFPLFTNGLLIPADTQTYAYDAVGNITQADNRDARIRRSYSPGGLLLTDTLRIRAYDSLSTDFSLHVYAQSSRYDLNKRRIALSRWQGDTIRYQYDPDVSVLALVYLSSQTAGVQWSYDTRLRPATMLAPGGVTETYVYDGDDRLIRRLRIGTNYSGPYGTVMIADTIRYDARGKVVVANTNLDTTAVEYDNLGAVARQQRYLRAGITSYEAFRTDALGNLIYQSSAPGGGSPRNEYTLDSLTARVRQTAWEDGSSVTASSYDAAGNLVIHSFGEVVPTPPGSTGVVVYNRAYFGADNRLRVFDKRTPLAGYLADQGVPERLLDSFEEYRYDALGRRVLRRARRSACEGPCKSLIERFLWDGSDLLTEIRYPGREGIDPDSLEVDMGYVMQFVPRTKEEDPPPPVDTLYSSYHGQATDIHGPNIDGPVQIQRAWYGKGLFTYGSPINRFPFYTWKGQAAGGSQFSGQGDQLGVDIDWPAGDARIYGRLVKDTAPKSWWGSLVQDGREESGLLYKRNRFYDPNLGRFTQEDPIGLAGGLNLYGFAGGDPVNFSDPFGLCPKGMKKDQEKCAEWNQRQVQKALAIVERERSAGNQDAIAGSASEGVIGYSESDLTAACPNTLTGCSQSDGTIGINADRNPAAISQTIVHERQHVVFWSDLTKRSENCARWRAVNYVTAMSGANRRSATSGHIPAYVSTSGSSKGCF